MKLMLIRHLWGVEDRPEDCFGRFVGKGYKGVETALPAEADEERFRGLLAEHKLTYVPQLYLPVGPGRPTVDGQLEQLSQLAARAAAFNPPCIAAHTSYDGWSLDEAVSFYRQAVGVANDVGVPIAHETHRGRFFFNPWNTAAVLAAVPELKLCVDFSHWVCVCERLLEDVSDLVAEAAGRAIHVHARVGFEEGPQVPDPRVEAYRRHLEAHERWWDLVWDAQCKAGLDGSTLTPEFGPPGYLHTDPRTGEPLADLETVCDWMAKRQAKRFAARQVN